MEAKQKRRATRADEDNGGGGGGVTEVRKYESSCEKGWFGHIPK